jgi:hypothetical protein
LQMPSSQGDGLCMFWLLFVVEIQNRASLEIMVAHMRRSSKRKSIAVLKLDTVLEDSV